MFELSLMFLGLALLLGAWDLLMWMLSALFPNVKLFRQLRIPDWKWPRR